MKKLELDNFDRKILRELNSDGRIAFSLIAKKLEISNNMVHQRVAKLFENGALEGIKPIINEKKIGYDWGAFTGVTLERDCDSDIIIKELEKIPEVIECYYITGSYTLFLRIIATSHQHMKEILYDKLDNIAGIQKTDSIIELGCAFKKNTPMICNDKAV